jgi:hypothetical protein
VTLLLFTAVVMLGITVLVERYARKRDVRLLISCIAQQSADDMVEITEGCGYLAGRIGQLDRRIHANHEALSSFTSEIRH